MARDRKGRRSLKSAIATRDRIERVRRTIIDTGGSTGWLKGVTTDALRAGNAVRRLEHVIHINEGGLL